MKDDNENKLIIPSNSQKKILYIETVTLSSINRNITTRLYYSPSPSFYGSFITMTSAVGRCFHLRELQEPFPSPQKNALGTRLSREPDGDAYFPCAHMYMYIIIRIDPARQYIL